MESSVAASSPASDRRRFTCQACGQMHRVVALAPGQKAWCVRCGSLLAKGSRFGLDSALACALGAGVLAVPAMLLPFVTVSKLANERVGLLFTGVTALWGQGMRLLAVWVAICGGLVPLLLVGTLAALLLPARFGRAPVAPRLLSWVARALEHWAMPEVQVLAVLVAMIKLHTLVHVRIGPGFWCYVGLSLLTLLAWRGFELDFAAPGTVRLARAPAAA